MLVVLRVKGNSSISMEEFFFNKTLRIITYFRLHYCMRKVLLIPVLLLIQVYGIGQTLGGNSVYNFLKLSNTPQLTGLGGINVSNQSADIGLAWQNPALLRPSMHTQANFVFNAFYGDIRNYHLFTGFRHKASELLLRQELIISTMVLYRKQICWVPASVISGPRTMYCRYRPVGNIWNAGIMGLPLSLFNSNYGQYRSSGLAMDIGISYADTA